MIGRRAIPFDTLSRVAFVGLTLSVTSIGREFPEDGLSSFWFGRTFFSMPLHYPLFFLFLALLLPYAISGRSASGPARFRAHGMWNWVMVSCGALVLAIGYAIISQVPEPFVDWRNLVALALACAFALRWLSGRVWRVEAVLDLAIGYGIVAVIFLIRWLAGIGEYLFDVLIPVFYWPALFMILFASLVLVSTWLAGIRHLDRLRRIGVMVGGLAATLVIALSFRRSFWLGWVVGMVVVVATSIRAGHLRSRKAFLLVTLIVLAGAVAFAAFGAEAFTARLASIAPGSETAYSATNQDHVNDLIEALNQIEKSPILGLGIGQFYDTPLLATWKEESFEVHNSLLHAWVKFGLLGLVAFLGFHFSWVRASLRVADPDPTLRAAHAGVAAYVVGQLANTFTQTWVYGRFQMAVHLGVVLACLLVAPSKRPLKKSMILSATSRGAA